MTKHSLFMGYKINNLSLEDLVNYTSREIRLKSKKNLVFSCANPHSLAVADQQFNFRQALQDAELLVTDGIGLSIVGRLFGVRVTPRITGGEYFTSLMGLENSRSNEVKTKVFFFGSSERVLLLLQQQMTKLYPNLEFCGFISPPYGQWSDQQNDHFIDQINFSAPDILWVGMTAPKQELWTFQNRHKLNVGVIGNVGAVFDFCAGTYERAPLWAQKFGVEWLVRLCKEPKRMWKRNFISPFVFTIAAFRATFLNKQI